jgi:hypothetical protein
MCQEMWLIIKPYQADPDNYQLIGLLSDRLIKRSAATLLVDDI